MYLQKDQDTNFSPNLINQCAIIHLNLMSLHKNYAQLNTPFGKFAYNQLAMGLAPAPNFCQEIMESIFRDIEDCDIFIDDIGVFSNSWDSHLNTLNKILQRLEDNGFTVNPTKCEWVVKETDWLGYWLTPNGLKPWKKKVAGILAMQKPKTLKQLRSFIGAVNYYGDLWPRRSHILHPLTELTGKSIFEWTEKHDKAFETMKSVLTLDVQNAYPNHNLPFKIYRHFRLSVRGVHNSKR